MLVDEITIKVHAGNGGDGVVRWLHAKGKEFGGPAGGDGGRGGDVVLQGVRDVGLLAKYKNEPSFKAESGESGSGKTMHGRDGKEFIFPIPIGSRITNVESGFYFDIEYEGQEVKLLSGGRGGRGNASYKSASNQDPYEMTKGEEGEWGIFRVELSLIADIGLLGLPNAGKSSLLNALTGASSAVGSYPFTTLEPHLGIFDRFVVADVPGIIEGASSGKGLGQKFLKHISRTKLLLHLISCEENVVEAYSVIRNELLQYGRAVENIPEVAVLTKADLFLEEEVDAKLQELKAAGIEALVVSVEDSVRFEEFRKTLRLQLSSVVPSRG